MPTEPIGCVKQPLVYVCGKLSQLNNKQSSAVDGRMQTLNYKKQQLTMKPVVTQVDATELTDKTG